MKLIINDLENIREAARTFLATALPEHRAIAFYGKMGVGKTTFIKALCEELGVEDTVTSPTFAIVNEYSVEEGRARNEEGISKVFHFDFYRIKRLEEAYDIGCEEYFYRKDALCLIEWPELIEELLPHNALHVTISEQPDGTRELRVDS